jgi:hypothetical protein
MKTHLDYSEGSDEPRLFLTELTGDEARTIYFALRDYADHIVRSINEAQERVDKHLGEDLMFLGETLQGIGKVLYDMTENHEPIMKTKVQEFLNV